jgi:hypothetical protein
MKINILLIFLFFLRLIVCDVSLEDLEINDRCCLLKKDGTINEENMIRFMRDRLEKFEEYLDNIKKQDFGFYKDIISLVDKEKQKETPHEFHLRISHAYRAKTSINYIYYTSRGLKRFIDQQDLIRENVIYNLKHYPEEFEEWLNYMKKTKMYEETISFINEYKQKESIYYIIGDDGDIICINDQEKYEEYMKSLNEKGLRKEYEKIFVFISKIEKDEL